MRDTQLPLYTAFSHSQCPRPEITLQCVKLVDLPFKGNRKIPFVFHVVVKKRIIFGLTV